METPAIAEETSCETAPNRFSSRAWLVAALWLQFVVVIFAVIEIRRVTTPMTLWLKKILSLFGC
jgi:hypothetical protein